MPAAISKHIDSFQRTSPTNTTNQIPKINKEVKQSIEQTPLTFPQTHFKTHQFIPNHHSKSHN